MLSFYGDTTFFSILVLSRAIEDNIDLGISVEEYFSNVSEAVEDIACPIMAEIACDQRYDATLHQINTSSEHY